MNIAKELNEIGRLLTARNKRVILEVVVTIPESDDPTFPLEDVVEEAVHDAMVNGTRRLQKQYGVNYQGLGQTKVR